ncbi:hypothetical protein BJ741DRAFT_634299 [Chytriomyces cf. hyalinus JEL632]|nr:hypothetical protein BJ741DRAFT_634299 [Chytriomyces cf. hyalinus JEL632]
MVSPINTSAPVNVAVPPTPAPSPVQTCASEAQPTTTPVATQIQIPVPQDKKIKAGGNGADPSSNVSTGVKRNFVVVYVAVDGEKKETKGGKYSSGTPAGAARKAANHACKVLFKDSPLCTIEISIREVSKAGVSKEYSYMATRKTADKAVEFSNATQKIKIPFKYTMELKSLKQDVKVVEPIPVGVSAPVAVAVAKVKVAKAPKEPKATKTATKSSDRVISVKEEEAMGRPPVEDVIEVGDE